MPSVNQPLPSLEILEKRSKGWLFVLPVVFVAIRCAFAPMSELFADEAYYWVWSRHLQLGYFDHAPIVAWLIRGSTAILGNHELAVRLPAILLGGMAMLGATWLAMALGASLRTLWLVQVMLLCFPMLHVTAAIITPDTPALAFTLMAVAAGVNCYRWPEQRRWWVLLGLLGGLAMLSKYMAVLPIGATYVYLMIGRRQKWPAVILSGLVAVAVVGPMLWWNWQNDFVSFRFQLGHGMGADSRRWYVNVGDYLGAQILVATPVLFPLLLWAGWRAMVRGPGERRLVATAAGLLLLFFFYSSFRHKVEANWPSLAWPLLLVLLAPEAEQAEAKLAKWLRTGIVVSAIGTLILFLPPALLARINKHAPPSKTGGWRQLVEEIQTNAGGRPIVCAGYQDASLFAFYLTGQPDVPVIRDATDRPSQFDLWPLWGVRPGEEFVLVLDYAPPIGPMPMKAEGREVNVEVLSSQYHLVRVDGLDKRGRAAAVCRIK